MTVGVFELFKVGIGPSSSHTTGPMRAAARFADRVAAEAPGVPLTALRVDLYGSLGATGHGHGTLGAVVLGLGGARPETVDPSTVGPTVARVGASGSLDLGGVRPVPFDPATDVVFHTELRLTAHPNTLTFRADGPDGAPVVERTYYSVGGGFVVEEGEVPPEVDPVGVPHPFTTADELLEATRRTGRSVSAVVLANETVRRTEAEVRAGILALWAVMARCIEEGCIHHGVLPGGLGVPRRAAALLAQLSSDPDHADPLRATEWVTAWALAVNEENAAGGRVVTAPTNGAAGIVPAVLQYYVRFLGGDDDGIVRFLLAATAVGQLCKENASLSGAEVGCQGEVGVACSMAAAGLAEVLGGTPEQVENAAEIGIEHHLGLTCDPVGGLVQIPCIERNAVGAMQAIQAARLAVRGTGVHHVSLDQVVRTMRETGADMQEKYKETSRGGLAVNVVEC